MKAEPKTRLSIADQLHSLRQNRIYLTMMVLLLIGAVIWVIATIMSSDSESEVATKALKYATPINPNLDTVVFATVESKRSFTAEELEAFPINRLIKDRSGNYSVIPFDTPKEMVEQLTSGTSTVQPAATPTPSPSPTPVSTPSSQPSPTPTPVTPSPSTQTP